MTKEVYMVVAVDIESGEWWVDDDTFIARFGKDEGTWDTEKQEWVETDWEDNVKALDILNKDKGE